MVGEGHDLMAIIVDQVDGFAGVGQSIADGTVVSIDGDGEFRRIAAAEENEIGVGLYDGIGREAEVIA